MVSMKSVKSMKHAVVDALYANAEIWLTICTSLAMGTPLFVQLKDVLNFSCLLLSCVGWSRGHSPLLSFSQVILICSHSHSTSSSLSGTPVSILSSWRT